MRKLFALLSLLVVASMALAACGGGGAVTQAPGAPAATDAPAVPTDAPVAPGEVRANVLRINLGTYPDVIDPQKSSFVNEIGHLKLFYEGLTKFNEKLETVPGDHISALAEPHVRTLAGRLRTCIDQTPGLDPEKEPRPT